MATETFYKRIILSNEAAERLADGFDEPREPYVPSPEVIEIRKRSKEWLDKYLSSQSTESSEQAGK